VWPIAKVFVKAALDRVPSDYTVDYVYRKLKAGRSMMSVAFKHSKLVMVLTTEICSMLEDAGTRVCVITSFSAENLDDVEQYLPILERYAKMENCKLIRLYGRHGWLRRLRDHGYEQPWIALDKEVR
jgi:hypothetical protein